MSEELTDEMRLDIEDAEDQKELMEDQADDVENLQLNEKEGIEGVYKLFDKAMKTKDSVKVSNISPLELGVPNMSVRGCLHVAQVAMVCGRPIVAEYFRECSEIILKTSSSRKGWFTELFVSKKKLTKRGMSDSDVRNKKWSMFGENKREEVE